MKKAFDQTVRDLKRGVNKKVRKVSSIEQKVLDATSNESWGPHGMLLSDIAQASGNYQDYQIILSVIWKRINDTGKNWRHVYKALIVLEYLVAYGSERVIDDIREHAYQIQTLSNFQYIDSSGRDQGSNIRKKSQSLVVLVNDKDRILEVRQKAAANKDRFRNTSTSNIYQTGSYSSSGGYDDRYDDDRYSNQHHYQNGYGRERDGVYRDDDRYGRYGDPYGRDGDRNGREYEERYSQDNGYRGRSPNADGLYSSRVSGAKAGEQSQNGRFDQKYSEQDVDAPPSYEEAVGATQSPTHSERDGESSSATATKPSSPPASGSPTQATSTAASAAPHVPPPASMTPPAPAVASNKADAFNEFDPRGSFAAPPATPSGAASVSGGTEMDLLGSFTDPFTANSMALVPTASVATSESDLSTSAAFGPSFTAATLALSDPNQAFDDPFGDGPFKAIPSTDSMPEGQQSFNSVPSLGPSSKQGFELSQQVSHNVEDMNASAPQAFQNSTSKPFGASNVPFPSTTQYAQQELSNSDESIDILADILPPTRPQHLVNSEAGYPPQINQPASLAQSDQIVSQMAFLPHIGQNVSHMTFQFDNGVNAHQPGALAQPGQPVSPAGAPTQSGQVMEQTSLSTQSSQPVSHTGFPAHNGQPPSLAGFLAQASQASSTGFPGMMAFQFQSGANAHHTGVLAQPGQPTISTGVPTQSEQVIEQTSFATQSLQPSSQADCPPQNGQSSPLTGFLSQASPPLPPGLPSEMDFQSQSGVTVHPSGASTQPGHPASLTGVPTQSGQVIEQTSFPAQSGQPVPQTGFPSQDAVSEAGFPPQNGQSPSISDFLAQASQASPTGFPSQIRQSASVPGFLPQVGQGSFHTLSAGQHVQSNVSYGNYGVQPGSGALGGQMTPQVSAGSTVQQNEINFSPQSVSGGPVGSPMAFSVPQVGSSTPVATQSSLTATTGSQALVSQPGEDKFETKSTVWADTLTRGLVNLNISGPKINPLSDIGIDFDAMNRKEKRMEKPSVAPVTSTVTMGKAMGSGSGLGRAGATALRPSPNPMIGGGMGVGVGGPGAATGMGGYGGISQPAGVGMGMNMPSHMGVGMNRPSSMGMCMGMGMGLNMSSNMGMGGHMQQPMGMNMMGMGSTMQQPMGMNMTSMGGPVQQPIGMNMTGIAGQMQQPTGFHPGGYNPMMGAGNFNQQPYGGSGYR